jgi:hypothetical protein
VLALHEACEVKRLHFLLATEENAIAENRRGRRPALAGNEMPTVLTGHGAGEGLKIA